MDRDREGGGDQTQSEVTPPLRRQGSGVMQELYGKYTNLFFVCIAAFHYHKAAKIAEVAVQSSLETVPGMPFKQEIDQCNRRRWGKAVLMSSSSARGMQRLPLPLPRARPAPGSRCWKARRKQCVEAIRASLAGYSGSPTTTWTRSRASWENMTIRLRSNSIPTPRKITSRT